MIVTTISDVKCKDCDNIRYYYKGKRKYHRCILKDMSVTLKDSICRDGFKHRTSPHIEKQSYKCKNCLIDVKVNLIYNFKYTDTSTEEVSKETVYTCPKCKCLHAVDSKTLEIKFWEYKVGMNENDDSAIDGWVTDQMVKTKK